MGCPESLQILRNVQALLQSMSQSLQMLPQILSSNLNKPAPVQATSEYGTLNNWVYEKVTSITGKVSWFYEQQVTYVGTTQSVNLDFPRAMKVNLVEQIWNDASSKTFAIRKYSNPSTVTNPYSTVQTVAADVETDRILVIDDFKMSAGSRLQFYYSSYTAAKIVTIRVQADELV